MQISYLDVHFTYKSTSFSKFLNEIYLGGYGGGYGGGSGGAGLGCGLGHVWGEIRNGMLLGNPARGRPMLFASDELTAALKFQRQR